MKQIKACAIVFIFSWMFILSLVCCKPNPPEPPPFDFKSAYRECVTNKVDIERTINLRLLYTLCVPNDLNEVINDFNKLKKLDTCIENCAPSLSELLCDDALFKARLAMGKPRK